MYMKASMSPGEDHLNTLLGNQSLFEQHPEYLMPVLECLYRGLEYLPDD